MLQTADYATIDEAIQHAILDQTAIQPRLSFWPWQARWTATRSTSPIATGSCVLKDDR